MADKIAGRIYCKNERKDFCTGNEGVFNCIFIRNMPLYSNDHIQAELQRWQYMRDHLSASQ